MLSRSLNTMLPRHSTARKHGTKIVIAGVVGMYLGSTTQPGKYIINKLKQGKNDIIFDNHLIRGHARVSKREIVLDLVDKGHAECFCIVCCTQKKGEMYAQITHRKFHCKDGGRLDPWDIDIKNTSKYSGSLEFDAKKVNSLKELLDGWFQEKPDDVARLCIYFSYGEGMTSGYSDYNWIGMDGEDSPNASVMQSYCKNHAQNLIDDLDQFYKSP